jgi:hypothetical protein
MTFETIARTEPAHMTPLGRQTSPPASAHGADGHRLRQHLLSHGMPVVKHGHTPGRGANGEGDEEPDNAARYEGFLTPI